MKKYINISHIKIVEDISSAISLILLIFPFRKMVPFSNFGAPKRGATVPVFLMASGETSVLNS